jgi:hypothetical protein
MAGLGCCQMAIGGSDHRFQISEAEVVETEKGIKA